MSSFRVPGERVNVEKVYHVGESVVVVSVEGVYLEHDPETLVYEPHTLRVFDACMEAERAGDLETLSRYGEVYVRRTA